MIAEFFKQLHRSDYFSQFFILLLIVGSLVFFAFWVLPWLSRGLVRAIDGIFGGDKPPTPYKYKPGELYEWPAHWKMWKETGVYKKPEPDETRPAES